MIRFEALEILIHEKLAKRLILFARRLLEIIQGFQQQSYIFFFFKIFRRINVNPLLQHRVEKSGDNVHLLAFEILNGYNVKNSFVRHKLNHKGISLIKVNVKKLFKISSTSFDLEFNYLFYEVAFYFEHHTKAQNFCVRRQA